MAMGLAGEIAHNRLLSGEGNATYRNRIIDTICHLTAEKLNENGSIFVITPPIAALLTNKVLKKECVLFENEGMEAMFKLEVEKIPGIVAIHNGKKIK